VLLIGLAIADALTEAHRRQILHRDLKPENVILTTEGRVCVLDFSLAQIKAPECLWLPPPTLQDSLSPWDAARAGEKRRRGKILCGTPRYLAPELWLGAAASPASDVWSLGVMLYELLVRNPPYRAFSLGELKAQVIAPAPVPAPKERSTEPLPVELRDLVQSCLEKEPARRPSAPVVKAALAELLASSPSYPLW
jgi:serine/threonine-protein kinase